MRTIFWRDSRYSFGRFCEEAKKTGNQVIMCVRSCPFFPVRLIAWLSPELAPTNKIGIAFSMKFSGGKFRHLKELLRNKMSWDREVHVFTHLSLSINWMESLHDWSLEHPIYHAWFHPRAPTRTSIEPQLNSMSSLRHAASLAAICPQCPPPLFLAQSRALIRSCFGVRAGRQSCLLVEPWLI